MPRRSAVAEERTVIVLGLQQVPGGSVLHLHGEGNGRRGEPGAHTGEQTHSETRQTVTAVPDEGIGI